MPHLRQHALRIGNSKLKMLRRKAIGKRGGIIDVFDHDDSAEILPAGAGDCTTRQQFQRTIHRRRNRIGERFIVRDQDTLR